MFESPKSQRIPSTDVAPSTKGSDIALTAYAEGALSIQGRRGLVVGPADAGFGERLLELGARSVHLFDPLPSRAEAASRLEGGRGLTVRTLDERALDFRDGAFDFALVTELADVPARAIALTQIRRILERSGALLVRTRASGGIEYAELYDLLSLEFPHVTMIGEVPFGGVAFAELGADTPEVGVDSQLADSPPPRAYLALAAHEPRALDGYAIVQLPSDLANADADAAAQRELEDAETVARLTGEVYALREQLDAEGEKGMRLAMELETAQRAIGEAKKAAEQRYAEAMQASQEASVALQARLAVELEEKIQASQFDLATRLEETEAQLLLQDAQVVRLSEDLIEAKKKLDVPHVDAKVAEELAERLALVERKRAAIEIELGALAGEHVAEVSSLEAQLLDRGRMLKAQDAELLRRATMVEDLLSALEDAQAGATVTIAERPIQDDARFAELRTKLDELALEIARREGELEARAWKIKELELEKQIAVSAADEAAQAFEEARSIARTAEKARAAAEARARDAEEASAKATTAAKSAPEGDAAKVARLEEELFVLRQAMVQEHEARVRAEAGDTLAALRDELREKSRRIEELEGKNGG